MDGKDPSNLRGDPITRDRCYSREFMSTRALKFEEAEFDFRSYDNGRGVLDDYLNGNPPGRPD